MRIAIRTQGDVLIAVIHDALTDADLLALRDLVIDRVTRSRSRGAILDVNGADVIDSFAAHTLRATADALRLRGAATVIVGIQPPVALAMHQLGLTLDGIHTALDLEAGLVFLNTVAARDRPNGR